MPPGDRHWSQEHRRQRRRGYQKETRIMFSQKATSRALGALFGLAATLTTMLAPAYAATPATDASQFDLAPITTTTQTRGRMEALSDPLFKPDVRVTYVGPGYKSGKYLYRFKVENIG